MGSSLRVTAIVCLLAACAPVSSPTSSAPPDNDWLLVAHGPPGTMAALLTGQLEIDLSSRCVRVRTGDQAIAVIFIEGTVLDDSDPEHPAIAFKNGSRFEAGEQVIFGGGSLPVTDIADSTQGSYSGITIPPPTAMTATCGCSQKRRKTANVKILPGVNVWIDPDACNTVRESGVLGGDRQFHVGQSVPLSPVHNRWDY